MVKAVFDELAKPAPKNHFTIGIMDDVTHLSLAYDADLDIEPEDVHRGVFFGLGSDGTVGANKNSIKIIGEETENHAQGYFVYDSKKAGAITISHLRFGPRQIRSSYLIKQAKFVACHQYEFMDKYDVLGYAAPGGVFLLNSPFGPDEIWDELAREVQEEIIEKKLAVLRDRRLQGRARHGHGHAHQHGDADVLLRHLRRAAARRGHRPDQEGDREDLRQARPRGRAARTSPPSTRRWRTSTRCKVPGRRHGAPARCRRSSRTPRPDFVKRVTAVMLANKGDLLPVSAFPVDGTWPTGTAQWEKRNIAQEIPVWDATICIQCNKCAMVCPHAAIRAKVYESDLPDGRAGDLQVRRLQGQRVQGAASTRSRSRPRTARAARCASWSARPRTRPTRSTSRSTCTRSVRCATPSARTTRSSSTCPRSIAPRSRPT